MLRFALFSLLTIVAVTAGVTMGLFIPRILAQEPPPQVGQGALSRVSIVNSDKCSATITYDKAGDVSKDATINVPPGQCNKMTGEQIAAIATTEIQTALDFCQELSTLPDNDPDKTTDPITTNPRQKSLRWVLKPDGLTYLCSSPVTVLVTWDGSQYSLEWRSTNAG